MGTHLQSVGKIWAVRGIFIVDDWLDAETCRRLMDDGETHCPTSTGRTFHGGRHYIPNTTDDWRTLVQRSKAWQDLETRLTSPEFLSWIIDELDDHGMDADLVPARVYNRRRTAVERLFRGDDRSEAADAGRKMARRLHQAQLGARRRFVYRWNRLLRRKTVVELLCDYSRATDGYGRVVHRDSDMRRYVFLLYLNALDDAASGGHLDVYRPADDLTQSPAWPNEEQCVHEDSVAPARGRLVVFRNAHDSYHGVATMKGHGTVRHFVYGGFTQLGGTNPNMTESAGSIPTEFHLYA